MEDNQKNIAGNKEYCSNTPQKNIIEKNTVIKTKMATPNLKVVQKKHH